MLLRHSSNPQALLDASVRLVQAGYLSYAEKLLDNSLAIDGTSSDCVSLLALIYHQTLRHGLSLEMYSRLPLDSNALMAFSYSPDLQLSDCCRSSIAWESSLPIIDTYADYSLPQSYFCIGFISSDLCQHPVGLFLLPLIELLSCYAEIELFFYENNPRIDWLSSKLQTYGIWCNTSSMSDESLAKKINSDALSVLIDLSGHTGGNRLTALRFRPCSVQISWLGYWSTTGLSGCFDAVLADEVLVPKYSSSYSLFTEDIHYLPNSRWCYRPVPWMPPATTQPPCLQKGYVTFGSFNTSSKLNINLLKCWATILIDTANSHLYLKSYQLEDSNLRETILSLFNSYGIDSSRICLEGPSNHSDLLLAYGDVDIALDTFPFNGGLTSCEALWLGLPLVSLTLVDVAANMAARQGESILRLINRPEWIAHTLDEYISIAIKLANDYDYLVKIREEQRSIMQKSLLCDEELFTRNFLDLIRSIYHTKKFNNV